MAGMRSNILTALLVSDVEILQCLSAGQGVRYIADHADGCRDSQL